MTTETDTPKTVDVTVKEQPPSVCEPAPLGLIGLAVAALVLATADLGITDEVNKAYMIPWAICLGATAQLIAGIMDFKRNNIFGATAFTTYSLLWYSVGGTLYIKHFAPHVVTDVEHYAYGLVGFLIFSLILTVASSLTNKVLFGILICIDIAIAALAAHYLWDTSEFPVGLALIGVSLLSFYGAAAGLLNTMTAQTILPMGDAPLTPDRMAQMFRRGSPDKAE